MFLFPFFTTHDNHDDDNMSIGHNEPEIQIQMYLRLAQLSTDKARAANMQNRQLSDDFKAW